MSARHGGAAFLREAAVGFAASAAAAAIGATLMLVVDPGTAARIVIAALGLTYLLRLLGRSNETTGRTVTVTGWTGAAAAAWLAGLDLPAYVTLHVAMLWLARSLYGYSGLVEAALDLGLTALAACFAVWAALRADSLFLALWCFFLLQALHVAIPRLADRARNGAGRPDRVRNGAGGLDLGAGTTAPRRFRAMEADAADSDATDPDAADSDATDAGARFARARHSADEALRRAANRR